RLRQLPAGPLRARSRRGGGVLRGDDRRRPWLSLVQRPASQDLHGRHRFARPRRGGRRGGGRHQARDRAGGDRRPLRARDALGDDPGHLVQADGQAGVPHGPDPPPLREARMVGIHGGDPLLDHRGDARPAGPCDLETAVGRKGARMIPVRGFEGRTVAVFGLARTGLAAARALIAGGAKVALWDDRPAGRAAAEAAGLPLTDLSTADWSRFAALMLSPGVPLTHPEPHWTVEKAKAAGVEILGDIELFARTVNA